MNKRFVIILIGIVVIFAGLLIFNKQGSNTSESSDSKAKLTNHTTGKGTSGVTLTEYGDFQCPACLQYYPLVQQVKQMYGDKITFQFRHFPLVQIHPYALLSARAAEAAGLQGKFFEMHDLLYENQQTWSSSSSPSQIFEDYASQLSLNIEKFKKDSASESVNRTVQADLSEAQRLGYESTPTFEINGKKIEENPTTIEGFQELIDEAIKKASGGAE